MHTLRILLALTLILTLLLVKSHLDSISSNPLQSAGDDGKVLAEGGAVNYPVASSWTTDSIPNPVAYPEPTNPVAPTNWDPESIPVDVPPPVVENDGDPASDEMEDYWRQLDSERKSRPKTSPDKPKVMPKSDRVIVSGRTSQEDTSWLEDELPE